MLSRWLDWCVKDVLILSQNLHLTHFEQYEQLIDVSCRSLLAPLLVLPVRRGTLTMWKKVKNKWSLSLTHTSAPFHVVQIIPKGPHPCSIQLINLLLFKINLPPWQRFKRLYRQRSVCGFKVKTYNQLRAMAVLSAVLYHCPIERWFCFT